YPIQGYAVAWWIGADFSSPICMMRKSIYDTDVLNPDGEFRAYVHELGHNFQKPAWTQMENNVEVTTNIFSIYMNVAAWSASSADYASAGAFVKLYFYVNLRHSFGYEAFRQVFRTYLNMTSQPTAQQGQIDTWAKTFSTTVGYDISSFVTNRWRIAVSPQASGSLVSLPTYNVSSVIPCNATPFALGLSPCASIYGSSNLLTIDLSTWATLRVQTRIAIGLSGTVPSFRTPTTTSKTLNTTVTLGGKSAALFGSKATYSEPTAGQAVLYLQPSMLIPFDSGVNLTVSFASATTKLVLGAKIKTLYWMEFSADGSLFMIDKRAGVDVVF
ncbi:hypothetical protein HK405_006380, partial [Cladochytrium tenue]